MDKTTLLSLARKTPPKLRTKYQQAILDGDRASRSYYRNRVEVLKRQKKAYHARKVKA